MKKCIPVYLIAAALSLAGPGRSWAQEKERQVVQDKEKVWELAAEGEVIYDYTARKVTASKRVSVKFKAGDQPELELTADEMSLDENTGDIVADGLVNFRHEAGIWQGEHLEYNFKTRVLSARSFKTGKGPFFVSGLALYGDRTNRVYVAARSFITTDDVAEPGYRIRARTLKITPGKQFEATDAVLYLGNVPVFYWPRYSRSLERHPNNITMVPGYRSLYGPYLLSAYNWYASDNLAGSIHLDYRQKRGFGAGPDIEYNLGRWGRGDASFYYTRDERPSVTPGGVLVRDDRERVSFSHQVTLRTNLTAQVVLQQQSDALVNRDFFETDYRRNIQPASFLEINQQWPNFSASLMAQPQVNDFFETMERLPDLKITAYRQQLGRSPLYYESESSAGYYKHEFADGALPHYAAWRTDTFHQLVLPWQFFDWLNVSPRAGGRFTHYGEAEGPGAATAETSRWVFNTGIEASFKASSTWAGVQNRTFEVDGVRHIIEPSVAYVFVTNPSTPPALLPQFDTELASLRLLPIFFPEYNSIDAIDTRNVFRLGLRNKLQTKRAGQVDTIVNWELYTDWRVNSRVGQPAFADVFSDLDLKPRRWLTISAETRLDPNTGIFKLASHQATIQPNSKWSVSVGNRYFRNDPALGVNSGNNLLTSSIFYRLNENWGFRASQHYEARDHRMEEQFYSVYRDFRSWTGAITCRFRDNRVGPSDFTIAVTFSLKAFPRFKVGSDSDTPSLLLGS
jgi:LPS-assembly protein